MRLESSNTLISFFFYSFKKTSMCKTCKWFEIITTWLDVKFAWKWPIRQYQLTKYPWDIFSFLRGRLHHGPWSRLPRSSIICDWPLNSSWDHFGLHQGAECKEWPLTMELKVPKHAYIIHYHGPMGFTMREVKEVLLLRMSRDHGKEMPFSYFNVLVFNLFGLVSLSNVLVVTRKHLKKKKGRSNIKKNSKIELLGIYPLALPLFGALSSINIEAI